MDEETGRAGRRVKRARKLAVVLAFQNLLVGACLAVTLYANWHVSRDVREGTSDDNVHIKFVVIGGTTRNGTLKFGKISSSNMMGLVDQRSDKIYINCTGPYILYMDVCYKSLDQEERRGMLQLQVVGSDTPISSFNLTTSQDVCRGHHSIAYLKAKKEVSLHFYPSGGLKITNVTVGLNLLVRRCEF